MTLNNSIKRLEIALSRGVFALGLAILGTATAQAAPPHWSAEAIGILRQSVQDAPSDALPIPDMRRLESAIAGGDLPALDREATDLALRFARLQLQGSAGSAARKGWRISDKLDVAALEQRLTAALANGTAVEFLTGLRPQHPDYRALRSAFAVEHDPARRALLIANMERWRWMPHELGRAYVLVNAASFEAALWRDGRRIGNWRVIVGKPKSSTPTFAAEITGVTFNPWWEVPASIVRESVGALVRRNPALARERGYVWSGGHIRQRPGPNNALGQMKLVMPNPYSVYLHDTPNRDLFERDARTLSHGCVRVGDALGFAEALLAGTKDRAEIDAIVAQGETRTVDLPVRLPVYIAYFTAAVGDDGSLANFGDPYGRDKGITGTVTPEGYCAA